MQLPDIYPAEVRSYDAARRVATVSIPGITDGADALAEAAFCYPFGDKSESTEVEVLPGDRVWCAFINGDARHPLIIGYRPKQAGNRLDWRYWHHANVEVVADAALHLKSTTNDWEASGATGLDTGTTFALQAGTTITLQAGGKVTITSPSEIDLTAPEVKVSGHLTVAGGMSVSGGSGASAVITGSVQFAGGTITHNGKVIDSTHTHPDLTSGGTTGPVN